MMRTYWRSTKAERRIARAAINGAVPDGDTRINEAAREWAGFAIILTLGCAAVVAAFAVILAATGEIARAVGPFIAVLPLLTWTGRVVWKYTRFRRSLMA